MGWHAFPSYGRFGGMLVMGDETKMTVIEKLPVAYSLSVRCRFLDSMEGGVDTAVYGPNKCRE